MYIPKQKAGGQCQCLQMFVLLFLMTILEEDLIREVALNKIYLEYTYMMILWIINVYK